MKFSTKTTYGLRAVAILAKNYKKGSVSIASISKNEQISAKYLERLFSLLKKAYLIVAEKGVSGGYKLAKPPSQISVYDVVDVLEGGVSPYRCLSGDTKCISQKGCAANLVLKQVQTAIEKSLKKIKLSNLV